MLKNMIRRGFTLVELIIVLVIVALLGAIAIAGYSAVVDKAEEQAVEATLKTVDNEYRALDAFTMATSAEVEIADMTSDFDNDGSADLTFHEAVVAADGSVSAGAAITDGTITAGDVVKYENGSGKTGLLVLASATAAGDITVSGS